VHLRFPYFRDVQAPATGAPGVMAYHCRLTGELAHNDRPAFLLEVAVPVMTVCPCSKAICADAAHSQRAEVRIRCRFTGFVWVEEIIDLAAAAGSSPVYTLLKREDEKHVTETAFANPTFVEDVVRAAAHDLENHPRVTWYRVEVESFESIHNHSAYAVIESPGPGAAGD
jgi:GTP cyclohydrolase I